MIYSFNLHYQDQHDLANIPKGFLAHPSERILIQIFSGVLDTGSITQLTAQLAALFPNASIIGTTTAGEILAGRHLDHSIVISFTRFEHASLKTSFVNQNDNLWQAGTQLGQDLFQPDTKALIVFGCGLKNRHLLHATPMLSALRARFPDALIAGGQAGDNNEGLRTLVFTRDAISDQSAVAVSIAGERLHAQSAYNLSWTPIGKTFRVSKVTGGRVFELDGATPYDVYCRYLGKEVVEALPLSATEFPLMIERDGVLMAVNASRLYDDGSFDFVHPFQLGEQVRIGFCHAGLLAKGAEQLFEKLNNSSSQVAFIYSCVSRKLVMGKDIEIELAPIESVAPSAGFFGYGEYFGDRGLQPLLFNTTMTVLSLAERDDTQPTAAAKKTLAPLNLESRRLRTMRALHHLVDTSFKESFALNRELGKLARKDALTGLANRYLFDERLTVEIKRHGRSQGVLSLIMLDVDHFKQYNDTYGHVSGDECLRQIAKLLTSVAQRSVDLVARYGGEEFVIILPETRYESALQLAGEIQARIEKLAIPHFSSKTAHIVTVSQGVVSATLTSQDTPLDLMLDLITAADQQLYIAKTSGRNQIRGVKC